MAWELERFNHFSIALLVASFVWLVSGCDGRSDTNKDAAEVGNQTRALAKLTTGTPVPDQVSDKPNDLYGVWRVTGVALTSDGPSVFSRDDPLIMGSEFTINAESLFWTKMASAEFTANDKCDGPRLAPVTSDDTLDTGKSEFSAFFTQFAVDPAKSGVAQHWFCDRGGSWGADADAGARMVVVGKDHMVMGWYDGVVLLMERVGR